MKIDLTGEFNRQAVKIAVDTTFAFFRTEIELLDIAAIVTKVDEDKGWYNIYPEEADQIAAAIKKEILNVIGGY